MDYLKGTISSLALTAVIFGGMAIAGENPPVQDKIGLQALAEDQSRAAELLQEVQPLMKPVYKDAEAGTFSFFSDNTTPPEKLDTEMSSLNNALESALSNIMKHTERLQDLSSMTLGDAIKGADETLGVTAELLEHMKPGGKLDQALSEAHAFNQRTQTLILEHPTLTEARKARLLAAVSENISNSAIQASRIDGVRSAMANLLSEVAQDRDYLVLAELTQNGAEIVEAIQQTADSLNEMADLLRSINFRDIPTS